MSDRVDLRIREERHYTHETSEHRKGDCKPGGSGDAGVLARLSIACGAFGASSATDPKTLVNRWKKIGERHPFDQSGTTRERHK